MLFNTCKRLASLQIPKRTFFGALNAIFNSVSPSRIKLVGPDRACAEWLMRNGAHIRWVGQEDFVTHYDNLPLDPEDESVYHIEEIFAKDSSISHHGFPYLRGCTQISRVALIHCTYVNDRCLDSLAYIKDSLHNLDIRSCNELTQNGLLKLGGLGLENLKCLRIGSSSKLKQEDLLEVFQSLQQSLPFCRVELVD
uniref:ATP synthase subunit s, mitochondrial n=7 Tax=Lygus hesperus TaxID=30085 RepID=A0A0A9ZJE5_LYGHE